MLLKRTIKRFQFIVPNSRWHGRRCWMWFAPAIPLLVPILKAYGLEVDVVEANIDDLSPEDIRKRIRAFHPDMAGITNMSLEYWRQAHDVAGLVKDVNPEIVTVMGGVHPTSLPERVLRDTNVDVAILGEGERRLPEFLDILQSQKPDFDRMDGIGYRRDGDVRINPPTRWIEDLDSLPMPDYSSFNVRNVMNFVQGGAVGGVGTRRPPVGVMMTSRGCSYRCSFCAGRRIMGTKTRMRSPAHVLRELDLLVAEFGIRELIFHDDDMYADRDRAAAIIDGMRQRKYDLIWKNSNLASWRMDYELLKAMKESGCYQVTISPESGSERVLKKIIHKPAGKTDALRVARWCRDLDIELQADFVIGFPGETWEEIRETCNFAEEMDADAVKFAVATPFPGTELFDMAVAGGYLPPDFDFYRDDALGFANPVIATEEFSIEELKMIRCMEWDRINFKTPEKSKRYLRVNPMSKVELENFRKETRRNLGVYWMKSGEDRQES